ncbi:unnamed protein product [Zymoseptoria tritici ST99CH_1A5]|uniref:Uncharacterized protein n=3 Tax=Zymoseptoria tritici TaxID=1047171 RepID=A0A1X7RDM3_ZYMT9|nr:unnamed protein product [Zymoseptoria tritici ST99CH_3D7]SMR41871.1 unnamed protein product [Zymoseptoria tritici ST99CH_1E4]SMR44059.1 unnamed protein product [Zymoseptoria tritici ST99CH_3D1]SMY19216.1 unnamed protein product [Zymoseptoria tritici ST99CH_1A5]
MAIAPRPLAPAPPKAQPIHQPRVTFFDLPAEMRVEIYKLALEGVVIHILPPNTAEERKIPHALARTSRQVRNEVLPMIQALCPIRCAITDFNFDGLLQWLARVPPHEEFKLTRNKNLSIRFHTSNQPQSCQLSLRRWLAMRADPHRPQANWQYSGTQPNSKVSADLRRRVKRMTGGKATEFMAILNALGVPVNDDARKRPTT